MQMDICRQVGRYICIVVVLAATWPGKQEQRIGWPDVSFCPTSARFGYTRTWFDNISCMLISQVEGVIEDCWKICPVGEMRHVRGDWFFWYTLGSHQLWRKVDEAIYHDRSCLGRLDDVPLNELIPGGDSIPCLVILQVRWIIKGNLPRREGCSINEKFWLTAAICRGPASWSCCCCCCQTTHITLNSRRKPRDGLRILMLDNLFYVLVWPGGITRC